MTSKPDTVRTHLDSFLDGYEAGVGCDDGERLAEVDDALFECPLHDGLLNGVVIENAALEVVDQCVRRQPVQHLRRTDCCCMQAVYMRVVR